MALFADDSFRDMLSEIALRDPSFLERRPVGFEPVATLAARYVASPLLAGMDAAEIERRLAEGLARAVEAGMRPAEGPGPQPRLAAVIADGIMDQAAREAGRIALPCPPRRAEPLEQVLAAEYEAKATPEGVRYRVRRGGSRWLLVVNAVGVPLGVWSRLLGDRSHDYKVLVVESETCDLVDGGMRAYCDLESDVARIVSVLDAEAVEAIDVIGWCSGGRIAVQLAAEQPRRVKSLVLASSSLRGVAGSDAPGTQFEEDIGGIFDSVARSPESAGFLSELLISSSKLPPPPVEDVMLFRLPHRDHTAALAAPLASGEALKHYCRRMVGDKSHDTSGALARIQAPILAISGSHDHVISNAHTWGALQRHAGRLQGVTISGAGHYAHDLQYPYFRALVDAFVQGRRFEAARVTAD
jgi:pimeloyl-ACP methyl ester carboxylesterase